MAKSPRPRLHDLAQAIRWIERDTAGHTFESFHRDRRLRQLLERNVEIISEASRHVPERLKAKHPQVPWKSIAGIGNVIRHEYDRVAPRVLWDVVQKDLRPLKKAVRALIREVENGRE
jgi:uncharacterized protein with HEPN domain